MSRVWRWVDAALGHVAVAMFHWVAQRHGPVQVYSDRSSGPICGVCRPVRPWPCEPAIEALDAIDRLKEHR